LGDGVTSSTTERVLDVTRRFLQRRGGDDAQLTAASAVCQDAMIFGIDVDDYAHSLEAEFGPIVRDIPWLRYTDQTSSFRGCGCILVPFWLLSHVPAKLLKGESLIARPDPRNFPRRLTFGHVAAVIDAGAWFEP
jgi:hypothetical protein